MIVYSDERSELIQAFIKFRQAADRWNDSDAKNLLYFDRYCESVSQHARPVTQEMIDGWCAKRDAETSSSQYTRTNIVAQFIRYLCDRGLDDIHPPTMPVPHPVRNYVPHAFTEEELKRFFAECDERAIKAKGFPNEARSLIAPALYRLLYSSGMRTIEVRRLLCNHVDLDNGVINIEYTKGREQHYVALHNTTREMLLKYDAAMGVHYHDRVYFFPYSVDKPLYEGWISATFRTIWDSVNSSHAVAYDLRHNYATSNINGWIDKGFDFTDKFIYLSKSMGHTKLESTKYYYSIVPGLSQLLEKQTNEGFESIVPEVDYE